MGILSDTELGKLAKLIVGDIGIYVDRVIADRKPKAASKSKPDTRPAPAPEQGARMPDKPLIRGEVRPHLGQ